MYSIGQRYCTHSLFLWISCFFVSVRCWVYLATGGSALLQVVPVGSSLFQVVSTRSSSFHVLVCTILNLFLIQRLFIPEAAIQRFSKEKLFWKYAANLQENTHAEGAISIKLQSYFIEITLQHWRSPVNLLRIFRAPFSYEQLWMAASDIVV